MSSTVLQDKLINEIKNLPRSKVFEVIDFVSYLKLKEDDWFIAYVNKRGRLAKAQKKRGMKFTSLEELQKAYK
ncbi:MAG: hypothetical protein HY805_04480 [Nitrospirae bacterium]|nr:hypothetical protein [Nitrospirota bacterium]